MADSLSSVSGVATGVDWKSLVDSIIKAERRPADRMQTAIDANTKRKTALADLATQLRSLQDAAAALRNGTAAGGAFAAFTSAADGKDADGRTVLGVAATAGAVPGNYTVGVTQLASAEKFTAGVGFAPTATLPATGGFSLTRTAADGTVATLGSVTVDATSTLASVRDAINQFNTGTTPSGVTASLVNVGANDQRLVLTATSSGAANGFAIADGGRGVVAALGLDTASTTTPPRHQAAQDATFTVDGLPVTRSTNSVSDVLPGVTLTLSAVGSSAVSVARDPKAATDAGQAFVDAYNKIVGTLKTQTAPGKALAGDSFARTLRGSLASTLLASAPTGGGVAEDLAAPGPAGIAVQKAGTVKFDAQVFAAAAGSRLPDLTAMLADRMGAMSSFVDTAARPVTGMLDERAHTIDDLNQRLQTRIDTVDDRLDKKRTALLALYSKYEAGIGRLQSLGTGLSSQLSGLNKSSS